MRLIDADTLFLAFENAEWYNNADRDEIAEKLLLNAPTICPMSDNEVIEYCVEGPCSYCQEFDCYGCGEKINVSE